MRALVLAGGGSKGAYQVGALSKWMSEDKIDYEIVCGTSVGAINAAFLAQTPLGMPGAAQFALQYLWNTVNTKKIWKRWFPFGKLESLWKPSVYNSQPVQQWIRSGLDTKAVAASGRKLRIVAVSFTTGEAKVVTENEPNLADWVIASAAFPVMLTPITIDGEVWTDGGLRAVTPLGEAIRAGATDIDVILCSPSAGTGSQDMSKAHAIPAQLGRAIGILADEVSRADLQICGLKNDLVDLKPQYRKVNLRVLEPSDGLISDSLDFDHAKITAMMERGYQDAVNWKPPNA